MTTDVIDQAGVIKEFNIDETDDLVRYIRKRNGYTQAELADVLGVSQAYVSAMERGSGRKPTLRVVKKIAEHFGISVTFKCLTP